MTVQIDGDTAATRISEGYPPVLAPEYYAEDLETVRVVHATSGDFSCKHCGERWSTQDEDRDEVAAQVCPQNVCEDPQCECGEHTHELEDAPMTWFEEATIKVDQRREEVSVSFEVNGKRFRMGVHYAANVDEGGSLVLSFPGTSGTRELAGRTVVAD
jgi:hypothetical protein